MKHTDPAALRRDLARQIRGEVEGPDASWIKGAYREMKHQMDRKSEGSPE